jgi:hypothetical protein
MNGKSLTDSTSACLEFANSRLQVLQDAPWLIEQTTSEDLARGDAFQELHMPLVHLCEEVEAHRAAIGVHKQSTQSMDNCTRWMLAMCKELDTVRRDVAEQKAWFKSAVDNHKLLITECMDKVQDLSKRLESETQDRKVALQSVRSLADATMRSEVSENLSFAEAYKHIQADQESSQIVQSRLEQQMALVVEQMHALEKESWHFRGIFTGIEMARTQHPSPMCAMIEQSASEDRSAAVPTLSQCISPRVPRFPTDVHWSSQYIQNIDSQTRNASAIPPLVSLGLPPSVNATTNSARSAAVMQNAIANSS